ncbi:MAG TPA: hypothetical protein VGH90_04020, partial [Chthoniobacteraceae bacterium]
MHLTQLKNIAGIFLIVPAIILAETFFNLFSHANARHIFWASEEFWFFSLGAVIWTLWFFGSIWSLGEPSPLAI